MFGYAQLGQAEVVFHLFKKMRVEGIQPDLVSFLILLTGCSHGGLLKQGEKLFDDVSTANFWGKGEKLFNDESIDKESPIFTSEILKLCELYCVKITL